VVRLIVGLLGAVALVVTTPEALPRDYTTCEPWEFGRIRLVGPVDPAACVGTLRAPETTQGATGNP